jgi:sugar phosphate isomerase/epimerase
MAELYFSSILMWNAPLDEIFKTACENGFAGIELWAQHFVSRGYDAGEYVKLGACYPVKTILHSFSWDLNLASLNDAIREASVRETQKAVGLANLLGAGEITVHPGRETLRLAGERELCDQKLSASLGEIEAYARRQDVRVSLEIMEKKDGEFIVSPEAMERLTAGMPGRFCHTLDVAHCDSEEEIFFALERLRGISKIHISNRTGKKLHTPLREGDYEFRTLLPRLKKYGLPLVVEGFDESRAFEILKDSIVYLKEIGGFLK